MNVNAIAQITKGIRTLESLVKDLGKLDIMDYS